MVEDRLVADAGTHERFVDALGQQFVQLYAVDRVQMTVLVKYMSCTSITTGYRVAYAAKSGHTVQMRLLLASIEHGFSV
jgi:hypothetical protein